MRITDEQYQSLMICAKLGHSTTPEVLVSILEDRKALLAGVATQPQPIYDEAAELEKFSAQWKLEGRIYRDKNTHQWLPTRDTIEGFQMAERVYALWMGWQACAQSRAKAGEVGHE